MITLKKLRTATVHGSPVAIGALAVFLLAGCSKLSRSYVDDLKPLNIVTYVARDSRIIKKRVYFGDGSSNVVTLTDYAQDGLLPKGDEDGLIDQLTVEIYSRGLILDWVIRGGKIYTDHLSTQKESMLRRMNRVVVRVLSDKFIRQTRFMKTASARTEYEISLKAIGLDRRSVVVAVDGQEESLAEGSMKKINGVYVMLEDVRQFDVDSLPAFAILQIGNQGILLHPGDATRIEIDAAEANSKKVTKLETTHFTFMVSDTLPSRPACELEDIFHSFLVDHPEREHVSAYRMVREADDTAPLYAHEVGGERTVDDPFVNAPEAHQGGFVHGIQESINDGIKGFFQLVYGTGSYTFKSREEPEDEPKGGGKSIWQALNAGK